MVGEFCALYIPLGEFFMFLPGDSDRCPSDRTVRPARSAASRAALFALSIAIGYGLAYLLLEVL
jgi:hypothetical protein